jgi:glutamate synthase domain-containing protein 2
MGKDCYSPSSHSAFSCPKSLLAFITKLRELSGGKPVGFKLAVGQKHQFMAICKAMLEEKVYPDFITVDGAEGGTGAAPIEFSNRLGLPINNALIFIHNCLVGCNLRKHIRLIASGKVISAFDLVQKIAIGADLCNSARGMLFSIGCIQSRRCNTNECPTGIATQDPNRVNAVIPEHKAKHVHNFHKVTMESFMELIGAMGIDSPEKLGPQHIYKRIDEIHSKNYTELYPFLEAGDLLKESLPEAYKNDWLRADSSHF